VVETKTMRGLLPRSLLIAFSGLGILMAGVAFLLAASGSYLPEATSLHRISGKPQHPTIDKGELHFGLEGMPFSFDTREGTVDVAAVADSWRKQAPTSAVVIYDAKTLNVTKVPTHFDVYALTLDDHAVFTVDDVASAVRRGDRRGWLVGSVLLLCAAGLGRSAMRRRAVVSG
jgi:hypothetical protein